MKTYQLFIDGHWSDAKEKKTKHVYSPTNGEMLAVIQDGDAQDAERALLAAQHAQTDWASHSPRERAEIIRKFIGLIRSKKSELASLLVAEQGKLHRVAEMEVDVTCSFMEYACDWARHLEGDIIPSDNHNEHIFIHKVPRGVVVAITAWNFPLALAARKIGPALITGNTVVLKPTSETPLATLELGDLANQAGIPKGVLNIVTGSGATMGDALCRSNITKMISMTGSTPAGQAILNAAANTMAHVQLELGGKAPFIVMEDADLEEAAKAALHSRFDNCGQVCTCNERLYVQSSVYEKFMDIFLPLVKALKVGDPMDPSTDIGPKINHAEVEHMHKLVEESVKQGATIACGGGSPEGNFFQKGYWFEPTILTNVSQAMTIVHEESFGPILPVIKFDNQDEAIAFANDADYGLAAMVFTKDMKLVHQLVHKLEAGEIYINRGHGEQHQGFHNGLKLSGTGGEDGRYGIEQYMEKKTFYINFS